MNPTPPPPPDNPRDLFLQALEHPVAERAAFLDDACRGDAALRRDMERLLADHREDSFLEHGTVLAPTVITPPAEQPGERIGRYKLLQQIGEGGFGTVWMAEQVEPVSRRVALKIIKLGMDTREVIARFDQERQALAMMDHPNIARVFDAGASETGRPFFVMELVKGVPLTQYCDEAGLGTRERLALFEDVCSAINHAHQKGIIHRDIKPSNVMITLYADKPVVKVIDFGIAKATQSKLTEKTLFTRFEQFIGTPVYMSPEQAALSAVDIDTRSDIYALGVLLYELLTGKPPFDAKSLASAGYEEMRRIIREVEPPKPSSRLSTVAGEERTQLAKARQIAPEKLNRLVEPDLDWIVMKAIEKDRTRRYETANGLALDIQRFLADEPVSATPPGTAYRFRKFVRRHRKGVAVASAMLLLLLAGLSASLWQAKRASKAEEEALATAEAEARMRRIADEHATEAKAVLRFFSERVLSAANPKAVSGGLGRDVSLREALNAAAATVDSGFPGYPRVEASVRDSLGTTYLNLGDIDAAVAHHQRAQELNLAARGLEDRETLGSMCNLAIAWYHAGKVEDAMTQHEKVLEIRERLFGTADEDTLRSLNCLAAALAKKGELKRALPLAERALEGRRKLLGPEDESTILSMSNLAQLRYADGQVEAAIALQKEAVALAEKKFSRDQAYTLICTDNLMTMHLNAGRPAEALEFTRDLIPRMEAAFGPDHHDTLTCMKNVVLCRSRAGEAKEALPDARELLRRTEAAHPSDHPDVLVGQLTLAEVCIRAGQPEEAASLAEQVVTAKRKHLPENAPEILSIYENLGLLCEDTGRPAAARGFYEKRLTLLRNGEPSAELATAHADVAGTLMAEGQFKEAEPYLRECLELREKLLPDDWRCFSARSLLGECLMGQQQLEAARPLLLGGWEGLKARIPATDAKAPKTLKPALDRLIRLYTALGDTAETAKWRAELTEIETKHKTP